MSAGLSQLPLQELNSLRRHAKDSGTIHRLELAITVRLRRLNAQTAGWQAAIDAQVRDDQGSAKFRTRKSR